MKLAALDLGSNSFHLLVAHTDGELALTKLGSHKEVLRLGSVVREQGRLSAEAFDRGLQAVRRASEVAPRAQLLRRGVDAARAETLGLGAAVIAGLVAGFGQHRLRISPRGLREGVILRELMRQARAA